MRASASTCATRSRTRSRSCLPTPSCLLSISATDGRYGTTKTAKKFWARWREEEFDEAHFADQERPAPGARACAVVASRRSCAAYFEQLWRPSCATDQDRLLVSLLADGCSSSSGISSCSTEGRQDRRALPAGVRHQGADRAHQLKPAGRRSRGRRASGTPRVRARASRWCSLQGTPAGRSLKECRVVVVTDRRRSGKAALATSDRRRIRLSHRHQERMASGARSRPGAISPTASARVPSASSSRSSTSSTRLRSCPNAATTRANMIVLVDEGHRSQGGENHERMRRRCRMPPTSRSPAHRC